MSLVRILSLVVLSMAIAACGTTGSVNPATGDIRSQPAVELPQNTRLSAETAGVAGALAIFGYSGNATGLPAGIFSSANTALLYIIYDPLAPNWNIEERALNEDTFHLFLRAKGFRVGGDGEAMQVVKRRALQLQREKGFAGYRILDYSEGIESSTPLTHRFSEGTIQLVKTLSPAGR